jgi:hypothetical protein
MLVHRAQSMMAGPIIRLARKVYPCSPIHGITLDSWGYTLKRGRSEYIRRVPDEYETHLNELQAEIIRLRREFSATVEEAWRHANTATPDELAAAVTEGRGVA